VPRVTIVRAWFTVAGVAGRSMASASHIGGV
jgi:hypothetical protein